MKIKRALISVSDKTGLIPFAEKLQRMDVEIISTGGTASFLAQQGIKVTALSEVAKFPEILDGRVKTLNPLVFAGILGVRDNPVHQQQWKEHAIEAIDLVAVNLYPFEEQALKKNLDPDEAIEWIDVGGPSLIRAAAKNYRYVAVLTDPADYEAAAREIQEQNGEIGIETRKRLAVKAFALTSYYDAVIARYLSEKTAATAGFSEFFPVDLKLSTSLRYGENPHQKGALYVSGSATGACLARAQKIQGKELSYNNLLDFDAAFQLSASLARPSSVIIKHNNPCGVAVHENLAQAYREAREADPVSAFGGIVAIHGTVDEAVAAAVTEGFIEGLLAKEFTADALKILAAKTSLRLLRLPGDWNIEDNYDWKKITGGALIQDRDDIELDRAQLKTVTKREPTEAEWKSLEFAWIVAQFVKSNAIVFANEHSTAAVGAGQMSRVDSVKIARLKAQSPLTNTVVASDAFFPFRDGVDEIAAAGATAIIQPGGSIRDKEVIEAADQHNMAMVFTGVRHFRH